MSKLTIKSKSACMWDLVSLGEVMLRLDPGDERISTTRHFRAWEGGGEYNVARGLRRCFGMDTAIVTALADNPLGRLVEDLMLQGGVSQKYVRWVPYDGVGRTVRNGLNFTERGFGVRAAVGCSDRGHTAASQLKPGEIDWMQIFSKDGDEVVLLYSPRDEVEVGENIKIWDEAKKRGVKRLLVNHPTFVVDANLRDIKELAGMGAYIEHSSCMFINEAYTKKFTAADLKQLVEAAGIDRTILGSDLGQVNNPRPVSGFRSVIKLCLGLGYGEEEIRKMISRNACDLMGIARPQAAQKAAE